MLVHPRIALASGLAAAAGAGLLLAGRTSGSVLTVVVLLIVVRAAPLAISREVAASAALARLAATAPAWVALVVVATIRAGSPGLIDVYGANAVAGSALVHGGPALVAAAWLAAAAGVTGIAYPAGSGRLIAEDPYRRLEAIGAGLQVILVAGVLAGPQVTDAGDLVPWTLATIVVALAVAGGAKVLPARLLRRLIVPLAVASVAAAVLGRAP